MKETTVPPRWRAKTTIAALALAGLFGLGCAIGGDVVAYDVPAGSARYTFESETNGVKTVWEYTSDRPAKADSPQDQPCMGAAIGVTEGECRPEPLIFLRYDLGLALDNTAKANDRHVITVTGYYQERLSTPPKVTSLQVEVSFDGGQTWRAVVTSPAGPNTFKAEIPHPGKGEVKDAVSLRITGADERGNTVKQTMPAAYRLS